MDLQRGIRLDRLAAGDPLDGIVGADQARQAHGAAEAREQAQLGFRQTDLRGGAGHAIVGRQRHLEAAAQGDAVDDGDGRERQVLDRGEHLVGLDGPARDLFLGGLELAAELGDVGADDEDVLGAGHEQALEVAGLGQRFAAGARIHAAGIADHADAARGAGLCDAVALDVAGLGQRGAGLAQFLDGSGVELVDRVVLAVKAQFGDTAVELGHPDGLPLVHGHLLGFKKKVEIARRKTTAAEMKRRQS